MTEGSDGSGTGSAATGSSATGAFEPRRVPKPWGAELIWALTDRYCGKVITIEGFPRKDGAAEIRAERITIDGKTIELR